MGAVSSALTLLGGDVVLVFRFLSVWNIAIWGSLLKESWPSTDDRFHSDTCGSTLDLANQFLLQFGLQHLKVDAIWVCVKVRNMKKGGLLFVAPPCSTWVFLTLVSINFSYLVVAASRSWTFKPTKEPGNNQTVLVGSWRKHQLSCSSFGQHLRFEDAICAPWWQTHECDAVMHVFLQYPIYMMSILCIMLGSYVVHLHLRILYAHQRGIYYVIEQPMTSVWNYGKYVVLWCTVFCMESNHPSKNQPRSCFFGSQFKNSYNGAKPGSNNMCLI